ncbi:hypothetical protein Q8A67_023722 [Cirrhinus molitorella]|uniref:Uncharacterized protein n=1 Tax=Cirrhinus molitorella TaxID=172907 RepID=A0AA88P0E6_9TELE|nr:hypothetical protein Q8A67_023722 [Cirrhinus molitorella]
MLRGARRGKSSMCDQIERRASTLFSSSPAYYGEEARGLSFRSAWSQTWPLKISVARGGCSDLGRGSRDIWMLWLLHSAVPGGLAVHSIHCCRRDVLSLESESQVRYVCEITKHVLKLLTCLSTINKQPVVNSTRVYRSASVRSVVL